MQISLLEETYNFENSTDGVSQLIEKINMELSNEDVYFSHLVIDQVEVFEGFEDYILDHLNQIELIEVKVKTVKQFVNDLFVSLNQYSARAIPEIEKLVDQFYQSPSSESWELLNQLLEGVQWVHQTIKGIDETEQSPFPLDEFIKVASTIEEELPNLLEAIENRDTILVADIIQYEILSQFKTIHTETEKAFGEMK